MQLGTNSKLATLLYDPGMLLKDQGPFNTAKKGQDILHKYTWTLLI